MHPGVDRGVDRGVEALCDYVTTPQESLEQRVHAALVADLADEAAAAFTVAGSPVWPSTRPRVHLRYGQPPATRHDAVMADHTPTAPSGVFAPGVREALVRHLVTHLPNRHLRHRPGTAIEWGPSGIQVTDHTTRCPRTGAAAPTALRVAWSATVAANAAVLHDARTAGRGSTPTASRSTAAGKALVEAVLTEAFRAVLLHEVHELGELLARDTIPADAPPGRNRRYPFHPHLPFGAGTGPDCRGTVRLTVHPTPTALSRLAR